MKSIEQREKERESLVKTEWIYKGKIVSLKLETYQFEDRIKVAEIVHHRGAVVILPIAPDGKILLIQQWRRAAKDILIELPAGTLEENEDPFDCAARELQEETGFKAGKLTSLGGLFTAPGFCDEYIHLYLATDLTPSYLPPDDDELIDLLPLSIQEAKHLISENKIRDAKTVAAILKYLMRVEHA